MKKIVAIGSVFALALLAACGDDDSSSASAGPNDDPGVESSSSEAITSSSSEEVSSISSVQEPFNPSEYRTCDKKYEGKFLLYQLRETLDALYGTYRVNTVFYKCENGKWSGPSATSPENLTEGDVIRAAPDGWEGDEFHVAPDDWECDAENEGQVQSWRFMVFAVPHSPMGYTPTYYARCEQGDWVLCEPESSSSSSSSSVTPQSSDSETSVSSSSVVESSSSVAESSSSVVTLQSSSSSTSVSSSSAGEVNCSALLEGETGWNWDVPKECRFNPSIGYGSMTDERDGKVYKTVEIGDQVWMAENLNYYDTTDVNVKEKGSCYGKKGYEYSATCDVAGRLYTWAAAMDKSEDVCGYGHDCDLGTGNVQGICPSGWHIPTYAEWEALFTAVGGQSAAGKILKSQTGWYGGNGTDVFGFSALPAGYKSDLHFFYEAGYDADFWSATERDSVDAYFMCLYHEFSAAYLRYSDKDYFFSVRCLKNN